MSSRHRYTETQIAWLREFGPHFTDKELLDMFNRRFGLKLGGTGLRQKRTTLGIKAKYTGKNYFEKNPDKFRPRPEFQFKKGHRSPRRHPPGTERLNKQRGEMMVYREAPRYQTVDRRGRIVQNHREVRRAVAVWEDANGPVPPGHCIIRLVDDKLDDRLEVLECITTAAKTRLVKLGWFKTVPNILDLRRVFVEAAVLTQAAFDRERGVTR